MVNKDLIQRKVKLIQEDLHRLKDFSALTFDSITSNPMQMAAYERHLERMIMRAIDINQHLILELGDGSEVVRGYFDTFIALAKFGIYNEDFAKQIAPSAGLRNRLVHDYNNTDPKLIFSSVGEAIKQYMRYCEYLLKFIEK